MQTEEPTIYTLNLNEERSLSIPDDLRIIFLCGVDYKKDNPKDKRSVLKKYLQHTVKNYPVILEEFFSISDYEDIGVRNLHDIETLLGCFSDAIVIIHESISTGAELGMLASNKAVASKILVLYPDMDSVEERKISAFIKFAFYGKEPVIPESNAVIFYPAIQKSYESNERYVFHTTFPSDFTLPSRTKKDIEKFLESPSIEAMSSITFQESRYNKPTTYNPHLVDYYVDKKANKVHLHISPMAMRCLLFSLLSISSVRILAQNATSLSELVGSLESELNKLLLSTLSHKLGIGHGSNLRVSLKGLELSTYQDKTTTDYRKTIGLFVYLLKAMGYLSDENNKKFKLTRQFAPLRNQFSQTVATPKQTTFDKHKKRTGM